MNRIGKGRPKAALDSLNSKQQNRGGGASPRPPINIMSNKLFSKKVVLFGIICVIIIAALIIPLRRPFLHLCIFILNSIPSLPWLILLVPFLGLIVSLVKALSGGGKWKSRTKWQKWAHCLLIGGIILIFVFTEIIIINQYRDSRKSKEMVEVLSSRPVLSLVIRDIIRVNPDTIKLTFDLHNRGNKNAEKVQIRFYLPDSLFPKLFIPGEPNSEEITNFQSSKGVTGLKFAMNPFNNQPIYSSTTKDMSYSKPYIVKLPIILVFKIPEGSEGPINNFHIEYAIDYDTGSIGDYLYLKIPPSAHK